MGNFIYYALIGVSMHRISLSLQQISLLQYRINGNMKTTTRKISTRMIPTG